MQFVNGYRHTSWGIAVALIRGGATDLLTEAEAGQLHTRLHTRAKYDLARYVGVSEVRSWQNSLPVLLRDIVNAGLGDVEVLLEHQLPHTTSRADVVLCGTHPKSKRPTFVVIELKQWTSVSVESQLEALFTVPGLPGRQFHPVEQVRGYCEYLLDHTPALVDRHDDLHGIAYLHNARRDILAEFADYRPSQQGLMFTRDEKSAFLDYLRSVLAPSASRMDNLAAADEFLGFSHRPTKPLLDLVSAKLGERHHFVLLDEQQVAYKTVLQAVERARLANTRTVVIVEGGPGSGKSAIAVALLRTFAKRGVPVNHATGSKAFTETLRTHAVLGDRRTSQVFRYFNQYMNAEARALNVLICDEAHRIRETSVDRYTRREVRARADRQVNELINAATTAVFLLDENQVVRPYEMGSLTEIETAARKLGCEVDVVSLRGQFRCGGSVSYDQWVARLLQLDGADGPPVPWREIAGDLDDGLTVSNADSPDKLESWVLAQQAQHGGVGRLAAGFCWKWSYPARTDEGVVLVDDVRIDGWSRPWNVRTGKNVPRVPGVPESNFWATDERGFGQVGCIYTAQGFEYDWSGVIFGPDLVWRDDRWCPNRTASHDSVVKKADDAHFAALIKNSYKVLLTRGMRGTAVYSTDPETQAFLERMTS